MTENEAIKGFNKMVGRRMRTKSGISEKQHELFQIAMDSLEEIQQYHSIGTVEECREAMERQRAKKPVKDEYNHDCCPNCGWIVYKNEYGGRYLPYCENCGQAIDWSD